MVLVKRRDPYRIIRGRLIARPKKNMSKEKSSSIGKRKHLQKVTCREADLTNDKRAMR